nr:hypothetical protein [Lujinxingiaceae bacterium]
VEATAKTVVTQRMKRTGSRWKMHGGQTIIRLRTLATSDRWDAVCDWHVSHLEATQPGIQDAA